MATNPHEIHLTLQQQQALAELARRTGRPWSELLEEAVSAVARQTATAPMHSSGDDQSLFERLRQRGLVGCLSTAPRDLSTNAAYMEGFGTE